MTSEEFFDKKAMQHSSAAFLNSLLKELGHRFSAASPLGPQIEVSLRLNSSLLIPLRRYSKLGRHQYEGRFYLKNLETLLEIDFEELVKLLTDYLAETFKTNPEQVEKFKTRVRGSLHHIRSNLEFRVEAIRELSHSHSHLRFLKAEQGLVAGHNFHPTPKSRDEFDDDDMFKYSPEFGGKFHLDWFLADPKILHQEWATSFNQHPWTEELLHQELPDHSFFCDFLKRGFIPVPMHPWQLRILLRDPQIKEFIRQGNLLYLGESKTFWQATSSLRSIYREDSPYMLKFSMSVKVTNSIRNLLPREVERGLQLRDVLTTKKGKEFLAENPTFKVVTEPAYMCLKHPDGTLFSESIVVCRENPFQKHHAFKRTVLAALIQDAPLGGRNLIQKLILESDPHLSLQDKSRRWFSSYLEVTVKPLILAQANYGIILGAHQQNLILGIEEGNPVCTFFRDCQGTGYSELGFSTFSPEVSTLNRENGNIVGEKMGNYLFSYYLILNSTFNVIAAISESNWILEEELIEVLHTFLTQMRQQDLKDTSCLDYLLNNERLMHKGNFLCSFMSINENTTQDPLSIYVPILNPISRCNKKGERNAYTD